jgi:hypothetical protein
MTTSSEHLSFTALGVGAPRHLRDLMRGLLLKSATHFVAFTKERSSGNTFLALSHRALTQTRHDPRPDPLL